MKSGASLLLAGALLLGVSLPALGDTVRTDYDHGANFAQYHTYSWGNVKTSDPFFVSRIKEAVDQKLAAKGWQMFSSGASATVLEPENIHTQKEARIFYGGFGGGWGGGGAGGVGDGVAVGAAVREWAKRPLRQPLNLLGTSWLTSSMAALEICCGGDW